MRFYGTKAICEAPSSHPILGSAKKILLGWQQEDSGMFQLLASLDIPASVVDAPNAHLDEPQAANAEDHKLRRKNIYKLLGKLKASQKNLNCSAARNYIHRKARATPATTLTDAILSGLIQLLETSQQKEIWKVDRAYVLRWFIGEEADWNLYLRTHKIKRSSTRQCGCDNVSNFAPFGAPTPSLCREATIKTFSETPWQCFLPLGLKSNSEWLVDSLVEHNLELFDYMHVLSGHQEQLLQICPLCNLGPSCTDHWLFFCPVVGLVLTEKFRKPWNIETRRWDFYNVF